MVTYQFYCAAQHNGSEMEQMAPVGDKKGRKTVIEMPAERPPFLADPVATSLTVPAVPFAVLAPGPAAATADLPMAAIVPDLVSDANPPLLDPAAEPPSSAQTSRQPTATPALSAATAPESHEEIAVTEPYTTAADAMKDGAEAMKSTMNHTTESVMATGKATFEQVATKSREAIEHGMKSVDEMAGMARGNVEAMLASSRAATSGIEAIAREVADFSRKTFEETTAAARAMTTVKTPNELMQLQNDFAKTQFDAAVAEMSKLSETMVKLMGEVFEPMQARAAVATDKMKSMVGTNGQ